MTTLPNDSTNRSEDKLTTLTDEEWNKVKCDGFCELEDPIKDEVAVNIVQGYVRENFTKKCMVIALIRIIINFYNFRYDKDLYVELLLKNTNEDVAKYLLVPRINMSLSKVLSERMNKDGNKIEIDLKQVISIENMKRILKYLNHHKGIKPEPLPMPIRSIHIEQIVNDQWDAEFISPFTKHSLFELAAAADHLSCESLLHLTAAKIASLIKALPKEEINRIIEENERCKASQSSSSNNDVNQTTKRKRGRKRTLSTSSSSNDHPQNPKKKRKLNSEDASSKKEK